jgi:hypothetical protein
LAFYENYRSIIEDVELLQKVSVNTNSNKSDEENELIKKLLGGYSDYLYFINNDGNHELSPPHLFSEQADFNFDDLQSLINKEKLNLNQGFYSNYKSKHIFELIHVHNEKDHDHIFNLLHELHKDENKIFNNDTSSDHVLFALLSKYKFECGLIDGWSPLEAIELDQNILSPNGILFKLLKDKYPSFLENIKAEYGKGDLNISFSQLFYLNKTRFYSIHYLFLDVQEKSTLSH